DLVGVAAFRGAREVGDDALGPFLGLLGTVVVDQGCAQRQVVGVGAGTRAYLALELGIGQRLVGLHVLGLDQLRVVNDHAGAGRKGDPGVGAEVRRHAGVDL